MSKPVLVGYEAQIAEAPRREDAAAEALVPAPV
jgi:hypothetical protein